MFKMGVGLLRFAVFLLCFVAVYGDRAKNALLPNTKVCGPFTEEKVVGGEPADLNEFPWIAILEYNLVSVNRRACHGSLINPKYVLTAAHCLSLRMKVKGKYVNAYVTSVRLGEYDITTNEDCINHGKQFTCAPPAMNFPVEKSIKYEGYDASDKNHHHDIGLLRLKFPVPFTEFILPGCLPLPDIAYKAEIGTNVFVAGWGTKEITPDGEFIKSNIKLKVEIPLKNNVDCTYNGKFIINSHQICAGTSGKDSCAGDSGAPLMTLGANGTDVVWTIIGVVSFGPIPCGDKGIYTSVSAHMDWILNNVQP